MLGLRLDLGSPVHCSDGKFGELADIVIDPTTRRVTHLVVQPHNRHDLARLVAIDLAQGRQGSQGDGSQGISLERTVAEINQLEPLLKSAYLRLGEFPVEDPEWEIGIEEVFALPYYGSLATGGLESGMGPADYDPHLTLSYDRIPKDKVEIRRESAVTSADGDSLGHVDGFVVDDQEQIAHLVLRHGHLWGKREIAIPIGAVARFDNDEVMLSLSTDQVGALKPISVQRWPG